MKLRNVIVVVLLIGFAGIVLGQISGAPRGKAAAVATVTNITTKLPPVASASHRVTAYYFHRTVRCDTCRGIEAQAQTAIQTEFANELKSGALAWRVINIEEPGNEGFAKEYDLTTPALVLVDFSDGRQTRWTKLSRVWELVHDSPSLAKYIHKELHDYLGGL